jgi:hypothetical protein
MQLGIVVRNVTGIGIANWIFQYMEQQILQDAPKLLPACWEQLWSILKDLLFQMLEHLSEQQFQFPGHLSKQFRDKICIPSDHNLCVDSPTQHKVALLNAGEHMVKLTPGILCCAFGKVRS